jgi:hypothetical protein
MKNIFCLLLFVVSFTAVMAQSKKQQEEKPALEQRVDSLQHELAFLKAKYELEQLNSQMQMYSYGIDIKVNAINIDRARKIFESRLATAFQSDYESFKGLTNALKERVDSTKLFTVLQLMKYSFSDSEVQALKYQINILDLSLDALEKHLDLYKISLDEYKKRCLE